MELTLGSRRGARLLGSDHQRHAAVAREACGSRATGRSPAERLPTTWPILPGRQHRQRLSQAARSRELLQQHGRLGGTGATRVGQSGHIQCSRSKRDYPLHYETGDVPSLKVPLPGDPPYVPSVTGTRSPTTCLHFSLSLSRACRCGSSSAFVDSSGGRRYRPGIQNGPAIDDVLVTGWKYGPVRTWPLRRWAPTSERRGNVHTTR